MNVICDSQFAVFMNPGSSVTSPVSLRRFGIRTPSLPSTAATRGKESSLSSTRKVAGLRLASDIDDPSDDFEQPSESIPRARVRGGRMVAMEGFWDFASHYWWLLFVFGGPIGAAVTGIAKHLRKASERRAELKLERYRIQQQYKHGKAIEAADAETSRQAFVAATQRLMDTHDEVNRRWLAYELDAVRLLEYPLMTDMREEVTVAFHRARRLADSLRPEEAAHVTDRETQREY